MPTEVIATRNQRRPAPKPAPGAAVVARQVLGAATAAVLARKGLTAAGLVVLCAASAVCWNALAGQPRRHPFPMFAPPAIQQAPRLADDRSAVALPPARAKEVTDDISAPPLPPARNAAVDPIGDLLRTPETGSIKTTSAPNGLALAQNSLIRLGYGPLKADGRMGEETRAALERFQRKNNLPVTGELGPRTTRALAAGTGSRAQ